MDHRTELGRRHSAGAEPLAHAARPPGRGRRASPARCWRCCCRPRASSRSASARPADHRVPHHLGRRVRRPAALRPRLAAAAPRHRRAGGDVPRGARSDARGRDHQRRRSDDRRRLRGALARGWSRSSSSRRSSSAARSTTAARSSAPSVQRHAGDARRHRRGRGAASSRSAPRTCGTACRRCSSSRAARRRRARTASTSRRATPRCRAARIRRSARKLVGFTVERRRRDDAHRAERAVRPRAARRRPRKPGAFEGMLFHLEKPTEYYVESNGVRSPTFTLAVVDLPTVKQLDLEYRFPAYTGLAPRKAEGGDVAAIRGTDVVAARHADDDDAGRADSAERRRRAAADAAGRRNADRQLHDQGPGLLPHRAHRSARREGRRVAAVHDRRHRRSGAVGPLHQAGPRHAGEPGRGAVPRSARRRRLRRASRCSCSTR